MALSFVNGAHIVQDVLEEIKSRSLNSVEFYEYLLLSKKCLELSGIYCVYVCVCVCVSLSKYSYLNVLYQFSFFLSRHISSATEQDGGTRP